MDATRGMLLALMTPLFCAVVLAIAATPTSARADDDQSRFEQRSHYRSALNDLQTGRISSFRHERARLRDYPLLPYLDYAEKARRLSRLRPKEVLAFRKAWRDKSPIAERLYRAWLRNLARRGEWRTYRDHYEHTDDDALECLYLRAMYATGDKEEALEQVEQLWLVGRSQPKECDPLFEAWVDGGYLSDALVWRRIGLALDGGKTTLARYLLRYLDPSSQRLGQSYLHVHRTPSALRNTHQFRADNSRNREIVAHGLRRLALQDASLARRLWKHYSARLAFSPETARALDDHILIQSARQDTIDPSLTASLLAAHERLSPAVSRALTRQAIRARDWSAVSQWLDVLPDDVQQDPRWQYWRARAEEGLHPELADAVDADPWPPEAGAESDLTPAVPQTAASRQTFRTLASDRSFYGYMAADRLNLPPRLDDEQLDLDADLVHAVEQHPGLQRSLELFVMGDLTDARREWRFAVRSLSPQEVLAAGEAATQWGWHRQAIQSTIDASYRDDLDLRFPVAYPDLILVQARAADVDPGWLYGIARQESAFMPDARSSAGALGILQVMPHTARITARKYGIPYKQSRELLDPAKNLRIGSTYLGEMLERFDRNRVVASAAYNAGPNRVERWVQNLPPSPADVWIESIPFSETRNYVQNVLVYAYIYGVRLGLDPMFLHDNER